MRRSFSQTSQPDWGMNSSVPNSGNNTNTGNTGSPYAMPSAPTYYQHHPSLSPSPFQQSSGHHPQYYYYYPPPAGYDNNMTMALHPAVGTINPSAMTIDPNAMSNIDEAFSDRATPAPSSYQSTVSFATPPPRATATPATPALSTVSLATSRSTPQATQASEKKPVKKRKSWGQELPTPKTNLPPRKRAKTDDEREQRRIERVLRNRAAAQSSRERKRQEVDKLEQERNDLAQENATLRREREQFLRQLRDLAKGKQFYKSRFEVAFAQLVSSHDGDATYVDTKLNKKMDKGILRGALVSPELTPSPPRYASSPSLEANLLLEASIESASNEDAHNNNVTVESSEALAAAEATETSASRPASPATDMTQHPAAVLCDLQCLSVARRTRQNQRLSTVAVAFALVLCVVFASSTMMTLSSLLPQALQLPQTFTWILSALLLTSLTTMLVKRLTPDPLRNWLTLKVASLRTETFKRAVTLATPFWRSPSQPMTARICFTLRQLLKRSLTLARPMTDATGKAMRLKKPCGDAIRARPAPRIDCVHGRCLGDSSLVDPNENKPTFKSINSPGTNLNSDESGGVVVSTAKSSLGKRQLSTAKSHLQTAWSAGLFANQRDRWKGVSSTVLHVV